MITIRKENQKGEIKVYTYDNPQSKKTNRLISLLRTQRIIRRDDLLACGFSRNAKTRLYTVAKRMNKSVIVIGKDVWDVC